MIYRNSFKKYIPAIFIAGIALFIAIFSYILFNQLDDQKTYVKSLHEELNLTQSWVQSKSELLMSDSRFSDLLDVVDSDKALVKSFKNIQDKQSASLNRLSKAISSMLSSVFDLMEYQRVKMSEKELDAESFMYHSGVYRTTQRLFLEIMSANLKLITSRFIATESMEDDIVTLIKTITEQSEALEELLKSSEEKKLFNVYTQSESVWRINSEAILRYDSEREALASQLEFKTVNKSDDFSGIGYSVLKFLFIILIPLILFLIAFLQIIMIGKRVREEKEFFGELSTLTGTDINHTDSLKQLLMQLKENEEQLAIENEQLAIQIKVSDEKLDELKNTVEMKELTISDMTEKEASQKEELLLLREDFQQLQTELSSKTDEEENDLFMLSELNLLNDKLKLFLQEIEHSSGEISKHAEQNEYKTEISHVNSLIMDLEELFAETRVLSLNAAVESARAGEKGKGFGIVADKIREISEKSQMLSRTLQQTIESLSVKIEDSSKLGKQRQENLIMNYTDFIKSSKEFSKIINDVVLNVNKDVSEE